MKERRPKKRYSKRLFEAIAVHSSSRLRIPYSPKMSFSFASHSFSARTSKRSTLSFISSPRSFQFRELASRVQIFYAFTFVVISSFPSRPSMNSGQAADPPSPTGYGGQELREISFR
jgi:hypothetical protein